MVRPRFIIIAALAITLYGVIWFSLRTAIHDRLAVAAQRDMQTIADLVSADLGRSVREYPGLKDTALLLRAADSNQELFRTMLRAGDFNYRSIYYFDITGRTMLVSKDLTLAAADPDQAPDIVRRALQFAMVANSAGHGAMFEPYDDREGQQVVGVWRWLPDLEIGVVAERPYDRFVQPIRWIDGIFGGILLLGAAAYLFLAGIDIRALRATFRRPDIKTCGPYEILRQIGEGTMSNVYLARHRHLKRIVALKRLKIHAQRDELAERFDREARLASQLAHPNIITILDFGQVAGGGFFYTMEFIHGLTLTQWVEQHGPLPPARAVRILMQICAGVGAMHGRKLLHRDIKPDNVIAYCSNDDFDLIKLLDFGLIKDLENAESRDLTRDVRMLGTPAFMAPERLLDPRSVDPRTDLYGIGCIGFFLLTGRKPFEATRDADLAQQVLHVEAPLVSSLAVFKIPESLDRLIASALAKDMNRRPANAEEFSLALAAIEPPLRWNREQARLWWMSVHPMDPDRRNETAAAADVN
ncbi:MAG: serine/threonine-protein kinase [Sterolibacterium sp.]|jgi:serine/threonine-protein kinase